MKTRPARCLATCVIIISFGKNYYTTLTPILLHPQWCRAVNFEQSLMSNGSNIPNLEYPKW